MDNLQKNLGLKIKQLRVIKGWSRQQAADELEMSVAGYGSIERGETDMSITRLALIAKVFDVALLDLMETKEKITLTTDFDANSNTTIMNNFILKNEAEKYKFMLEVQKNEVDKYKFMLEIQKKEIDNLEQQVMQLYGVIEFLKKIGFDSVLSTSIDLARIQPTFYHRKFVSIDSLLKEQHSYGDCRN